MDRCSTCGYRWVSPGWTCPRCGFGSERGDYQSEQGCTENCLLPLGCLAAVFVVPLVLLFGLALMTTWQFWVIVGVVAAVAGAVKLVPWLRNRSAQLPDE